MEEDTFYRDAESTTSVSSHLRGRRSILLDSRPITPFTPRDTNVSQFSHKTREPRSRRGAKVARTAPSSPVQSRPHVLPPRRPLTPIPLTHTQRRECGSRDNNNHTKRNDNRAVNDTAWTRRRPPCVAGGTANSDVASAAASSRWVSFSFASGCTSREPSGSRPSSPSPPPRRAIMPSAFPDLHFSDAEEEEEEEEKNGKGVERHQGAANANEEAASPEERWRGSAGSPPTTPHSQPLKRPMINFANESLLLIEDGRPQSPCGDVKETQCRGSLFLVTPPEALDDEVPGGAVLHHVHAHLAEDTKRKKQEEEEDEEEHDDNHRWNNKSCRSSTLLTHDKKRRRSPPPSPVGFVPPSPYSMILCGNEGVSTEGQRTEGSQCIQNDETNAEGHVEDTEDSVMETKRRRTGEFVQTENEESTPGIARGAVALPHAPPFAEENKTMAEFHDLAATSSFSVLLQPKPQESMLLVSGATPTPLRQRHSTANPDTAPMRTTPGNHPPVSLFPGNIPCEAMELPSALRASEEDPSRSLRPSEELVALIEAAREEVRRASQRLLAAMNAHCRTSSSASSDDASLRLSLSSTPITNNSNSNNNNVSSGGCDKKLHLGSNGTPEEFPDTAWAPPNGDALRKALVTNAGRILRHLRGYDREDVGFLPMGVVARVVWQILSGEERSPSAVIATPARGKVNENLSWCMHTPSHVERVEMTNAASPMPHTAVSPGRSTWEMAMTRQKTRAAEETAMQLYLSLWSCFRDHFGERYAAVRLGITATVGDNHSQLTAFPRLRQQLTARAQQQREQPPLDTLVDYRAFASSLLEMSR